jgi:phage-related protein
LARKRAAATRGRTKRPGQRQASSDLRRKRKWRKYKTESGNSPVERFFDELTDEDAASVAAAMKEVREEGLRAARHLKGDIWEVRADGDGVIYRLLFAPQGSYGQILLALEGFSKKTQKTPPAKIQLAQRRLRDWNRRGEEQKGRARDI